METKNQNYAERRAQAEHKVRRLSAFYSYCLRYIMVIALLAVVNWLTCPHYWWVLWVAAGWGIGLLSQALSLFNNGFWGDNWKERKIQEIMEKA